MNAASNDLQRIHDVSRGASECAKTFRLLAFLGELFAAGISLCGVLVVQEISAWFPLAVCVLLVASVVLRSRSEHYQDIALRCRRTSLRAYAFGTPIPIVVSSGLLNDAPARAQKVGKALPGGSIQQYYDAKMPVGEARLRYLYAYSSFFTWRVSRASTWLYGLSALALIVVSGVTLYALAVNPIVPDKRSFVLEALFSIVLGVLSLRLIEEALASWSCETEVRAITDRLITSPLPSGEELAALVEDYEFVIVTAPPRPSVVYKILRDTLEEQWAHRRQAVDCG
jgi:hypothetical protein